MSMRSRTIARRSFNVLIVVGLLALGLFLYNDYQGSGIRAAPNAGAGQNGEEPPIVIPDAQAPQSVQGVIELTPDGIIRDAEGRVVQP